MTYENTKPVKKFVAGTIQVAVWKNVLPVGGNGSDNTVMSVSVDRRYKDRDGVWKSSGSLRLNDVPKAILLLSKAYEFLATTPDDDTSGGDVSAQ